jgi:hypothetical protein
MSEAARVLSDIRSHGAFVLYAPGRGGLVVYCKFRRNADVIPAELLTRLGEFGAEVCVLLKGCK